MFEIRDTARGIIGIRRHHVFPTLLIEGNLDEGDIATDSIQPHRNFAKITCGEERIKVFVPSNVVVEVFPRIADDDAVGRILEDRIINTVIPVHELSRHPIRTLIARWGLRNDPVTE